MKRFLVAFLLSSTLAFGQTYPPDSTSGCQLAGCTMTGPILFSDGEVGAPSISFASDIQAGMYLNGANLYMAYAGVNRINFAIGSSVIQLLSDTAYLSIGLSVDTRLYRDAANTLALRNGANAQTYNVYNTWTDASNREYLKIGVVVSNTFGMWALKDGSGTQRAISLNGGGAGLTVFNSQVFPSAVDTVDLGIAVNQFKNFYLARSIQGSKSTALTDATATNFADVSIPQTGGANYAAGFIVYTIFCEDASNQAVQSGRVQFACHNLAGTESCGFGTPDGVTLGDGTASIVAPVFTATGGADLVNILVDSDCTGVTPTTHNIQHRFDMQQVNTVTSVP